MSRYRYSPLDEEAREIRLLTLLPGAFSAEISILLHVNSFTEHNTPKYEAVSYAWGSTIDPVIIKAGPQGEDVLAVTQDLATALQHFRLENETRILWIDAICVNQQNLEERGHQVQRMSDIYRRAQRVVVWLGPANDESGLALGLLSELSSKIVVDWITRSFTYKLVSDDASERQWADLDAVPPFEGYQWRAILDLLERSWFERLWIWQEIRLADPKTAIVVCGYDAILWENFRNAIFCLFIKPKPRSPQGPDLYARIRQAFRLGDDGYILDLPHLVYQTSGSKCADNRDRIYALLSIVCNYSELSIIPDYTKTTRQVYQDAALTILTRSLNSNILTFCEMTEGGMYLPSWVPNWRARRNSAPLQRQRANGFTYSNIMYLGDGVLRATGVPLAEVAEVDEIPAMMTYRDVFFVIRDLVPIDLLDAASFGGGRMLDAYCRTFCTNQFSEHVYTTDLNYPGFEESKRFLQAVLVTDVDQLELTRNAIAVFDHMTYFMKGRLLFRTEGGHIGLGPGLLTRPKDKIVVILGCRAPLILRPTTDGRYQIVGECYVDGFMNGEALLGPLQVNYKRVTHGAYDGDLQCGRCLNRQTGQVHFNNPRLDPLPENLQLEPYKRGHMPFKSVNDKTGEYQDYRCLDHRLSLQTLKDRGVDLQDFEFI